MKQLLPLDGKAFIEHCIGTILGAGIADIVTVVSSSDNELSDLLKRMPVTTAINTNPGSDMAESVRAGLGAVKAESSGVLICLCDHPLVSVSTVRALAAKHDQAPGKIVIPVFDNLRGHPTLFPRFLIEDIFAGKNLREVIQQNHGLIELLTVDDEGVTVDIDTQEEYRRAQSFIRTKC